MAQSTLLRYRPRFWITLLAIVILLVFLYFFEPFAKYITENIPNVRFNNVIFWFASLVGVVGFAISHWQSFRKNIFRATGEVAVDELVFETLQIAIMTAVIFCAGATLQAIEMLSEFLLERGSVFSSGFGEKALAIIVFLILALLFYLLHLVVRAFRSGWKPRKSPPGVHSSPGPGGAS